MHHAEYVGLVGFCGLIVNGIAYCVIGGEKYINPIIISIIIYLIHIPGYTFHQTSFLDHSHTDENSIANANSIQEYVQRDVIGSRRQDCLSTFRDVFGNNELYK